MRTRSTYSMYVRNEKGFELAWELLASSEHTVHALEGDTINQQWDNSQQQPSRVQRTSAATHQQQKPLSQSDWLHARADEAVPVRTYVWWSEVDILAGRSRPKCFGFADLRLFTVLDVRKPTVAHSTLRLYLLSSTCLASLVERAQWPQWQLYVVTGSRPAALASVRACLRCHA